MNSQFKFKPDKIKYLSNVDTLDSSHKKKIDNINKKRIDAPAKIQKLEQLENDLKKLEQDEIRNKNYLYIRSKLLEEIFKLKEELNEIDNYEEESEYYAKTYQILFNYYVSFLERIQNFLRPLVAILKSLVEKQF